MTLRRTFLGTAAASIALSAAPGFHRRASAATPFASRAVTIAAGAVPTTGPRFTGPRRVALYQVAVVLERAAARR